MISVMVFVIISVMIMSNFVCMLLVVVWILLISVGLRKLLNRLIVLMSVMLLVVVLLVRYCDGMV